MKGKDIAENLRHSRRKWGKGRLYNERNISFCVLGIKAAEAGVPTSVLRNPDLFCYHFARHLYTLNDAAKSKQDLIEKLDSDRFRNRSFPVERFIEDCRRLMRGKP